MSPETFEGGRSLSTTKSCRPSVSARGFHGNDIAIPVSGSVADLSLERIEADDGLPAVTGQVDVFEGLRIREDAGIGARKTKRFPGFPIRHVPDGFLGSKPIRAGTGAPNDAE